MSGPVLVRDGRVRRTRHFLSAAAAPLRRRAGPVNLCSVYRTADRLPSVAAGDLGLTVSRRWSTRTFDSLQQKLLIQRRSVWACTSTGTVAWCSLQELQIPRVDPGTLVCRRRADNARKRLRHWAAEPRSAGGGDDLITTEAWDRCSTTPGPFALLSACESGRVSRGRRCSMAWRPAWSNRWCPSGHRHEYRISDDFAAACGQILRCVAAVERCRGRGLTVARAMLSRSAGSSPALYLRQHRETVGQLKSIYETGSIEHAGTGARRR